MTPSTTIGSVARPMALSMSVAHARPRLPIFLSVTRLSGLKCCSSKVRPPTSQLLPSDASAITRASVTLPGLGGVSAEERIEIAVTTQKPEAVKASRCVAFIAAYSLILPSRLKMAGRRPAPLEGQTPRQLDRSRAGAFGGLHARNLPESWDAEGQVPRRVIVR